MKIAFKRRNITNRSDITFTFRQNRVNVCDLRAAVLVSKIKTQCTAFGVLNAMKVAFKRRNITIRSEITFTFRQNRINGCDLRAAVLVSKLKTLCTTFAVKNAMKIAFKRRNSSNRREITSSFRQNWENDWDLRAAVLVSKLKTPCTAFGVCEIQWK